ncbi:serine hydrolase domain-containing protein [Nonomuraea sp. NPDC049141]|uniref:serine hydrolase domain-containing protein n=1 Tax=Nonomuraea sp. NPDC049141 TaxID=3155500 RepID=UPI0033E7A46D
MDSETLSVLLARLVRRHRIPGAQLAVRWRGQTITAEAGEESVGTGRPVTSRSAFPMGSLTKPFTATLAMMLVADGDVELDVPLATYLPELGFGPGQVTLRQLLSHTGGLVATVDETASGMTRRRWVDSRAAMAHPPGFAFSYSNAGYLLAAHLVEVITGMSWRQAVESFLLRPLGIAPLFVVDPPPRSGTPPVADGHAVRPHAPALPIREQSVSPLEEPVAGLAASAADLVAFAGLHLPACPEPALLDDATTEEMRRDRLDDVAVGSFGLADGWGPGWSLYRRAGREWFGHDGTGDGAWCHLRAEPVSGTVVALMTNGSTGVSLWEALVGELRSMGLDVGDYRLSALLDPGPPAPGPAECAGHYANGSWTCVVEASGGELYLSVGSEPGWKLSCFQDLRFTTAGADRGAMPYIGRFLRDPATGRVDLLQITGRLVRRRE